MFVLVTYDVNTSTREGVKRLGKVAKICLRYGQRVQNSVFECVFDPAKYVLCKHELLQIIDEQNDSLRFYKLGDSYKTKIEHYGKHPSLSQDGLLII